MNDLQIIALVVFAIEFLGIGAAILSAHILFRSLEKEYPTYFKLIGRPQAHGYAEYATFSEAPRMAKGVGFVLSLTAKGIPANFPKDHKLRKLAKAIGYMYLGVIILFPVGMTLLLTSFP